MCSGCEGYLSVTMTFISIETGPGSFPSFSVKKRDKKGDWSFFRLISLQFVPRRRTAFE